MVAGARGVEGRGVGEVAAAELNAAGHDVIEARTQYAARPQVRGADLLVGSLECRARQSVRWLLSGDVAAREAEPRLLRRLLWAAPLVDDVVRACGGTPW